MRIRFLLVTAVALLVASIAQGQPCGQPPYHPCEPWGQEVFYYSDAAKTNLVGYEYSGCPQMCTCEWVDSTWWGSFDSPYYTQYCFECTSCCYTCLTSDPSRQKKRRAPRILLARDPVTRFREITAALEKTALRGMI